MNVQEIDFPSDHYNEMGKLRKYLMKALNRSDSSVTAAKVLASTLAFTASKLREVYKEDGIKSKAQEKRDVKEAARKTAALVAEAKLGLKGKLAAKAVFYSIDKVKEVKDAKKKKDVSKPKSKAKK